MFSTDDMFKNIIILSVAILSTHLASAQSGNQKQFDINSQTTFKDTDGNLIDFETFIAWTSGSGYDIEPVFFDDGTLKEIVVNTIALNQELRPSDFASTTELVEKAPPKFEVYDLENNFLSLDNYKNKVVVIKFWFAACPPCIKEIPQLNKVFKTYEHNPDVVFLGPSLDDVATIQASQRKHPFYYNIIPKADNFANQYNVLGYPTHVVINKNGTVEAVFQGVNHQIDRLLTRAIESGLNRRPNDTPSQLTSTAPPEDVVMINPNSVIVNEKGTLVPFDQFVQLMEDGMYELENSVDLVGNKVIMMKEVVRN